MWSLRFNQSNEKSHTFTKKPKKRRETSTRKNKDRPKKIQRNEPRRNALYVCASTHCLPFNGIYMLLWALSLSLSFFCQAKRWCVWCNLQINEKQLIIFCSFHFVRSVSNVYFILKTFAAISLHLSTCYGYKVFPETLCRLIQAVNVSTCFLTTILNDDHVSTWSCLIK